MNAVLNHFLKYMGGVIIGLAAVTSFAGDNENEHQLPAMQSPLAHRVLLVSSDTAGQRVVAGGSFGSIVYSDDQGESWQQAAHVPTQNLITVLKFVDDKHGWAGSHDTLILHTSDGGEHWEIQHEELLVDGDIAKPVLDLYFRDADHGIAIGAYSLLMTTEDGGATWEYADTDELAALLEEQGLEPQPGFHAISPMAGGYLIVGELGTVLFYDPDGIGGLSESEPEEAVAEGRVLSVDGEEEGGDASSESPTRVGPWTILSSPYEGSFFGLNTELSSGEILIYGLRGRIYRSSDRGATWQRVEVPADITANIFDSVELSDGTVIAVGGTGTLLRIAPGSSRAEQIPYDGFNSFVSVERLSDTELLLFGSAGVQRFLLSEP